MQSFSLTPPATQRFKKKGTQTFGEHCKPGQGTYETRLLLNCELYKSICGKCGAEFYISKWIRLDLFHC